MNLLPDYKEDYGVGGALSRFLGSMQENKNKSFADTVIPQSRLENPEKLPFYKRFGADALSGFLEGGQNILNMPHNLASVLERSGVSDEEFPKMIPPFDTRNYPEELNLTEGRPDRLTRTIIRNAPTLGLMLATGGRGIESASNIPSVGKKLEYLKPEIESERFRGNFGTGTTKETIKELGQRIQFANQSEKEQALIPKKELYPQEGKSNIYNVKEENLPEGNLKQFTGMFEPGERFSEANVYKLGKSLENYRENSDVKSLMRKYGINENQAKKMSNSAMGDFIDEAEEMLNVRNIPEKSLHKIEDVLSMPIKRDSRYFSNNEVAKFYSPTGKIMKLHNRYKSQPILNNYDALQSAIKKEQRRIKPMTKTSDTASAKYDALQQNVENLNLDKEAFMKTLPKNMQNLENEFRNRFAIHAEKYEKAPPAMKKLAQGKWNEVTGAQLADLFTNPTKQTLDILNDLGPTATHNILYLAMQKVPIGDAKGLSNMILDLKRTKGYDRFVTSDMINWANNMKKQIRNSEAIKTGLGTTLGFGVGELLTGSLLGGALGAATPFLWHGGKAAVKKLSPKK